MHVAIAMCDVHLERRARHRVAGRHRDAVGIDGAGRRDRRKHLAVARHARAARHGRIRAQRRAGRHPDLQRQILGAIGRPQRPLRLDAARRDGDHEIGVLVGIGKERLVGERRRRRVRVSGIVGKPQRAPGDAALDRRCDRHRHKRRRGCDDRPGPVKRQIHGRRLAGLLRPQRHRAARHRALTIRQLDHRGLRIQAVHHARRATPHPAPNTQHVTRQPLRRRRRHPPIRRARPHTTRALRRRRPPRRRPTNTRTSRNRHAAEIRRTRRSRSRAATPCAASTARECPPPQPATAAIAVSNTSVQRIRPRPASRVPTAAKRRQNPDHHGHADTTEHGPATFRRRSSTSPCASRASTPGVRRRSWLTALPRGRGPTRPPSAHRGPYLNRTLNLARRRSSRTRPPPAGCRWTLARPDACCVPNDPRRTLHGARCSSTGGSSPEFLRLWQALGCCPGAPTACS